MRPFAGFEALDSAAQGLISDAYDALASWHLEAHWLDDAARFKFFPHSEVLQRATEQYLTGDRAARRVFADSGSSLRLASKFLSGPGWAAPADTPVWHRFCSQDLAPIRAVIERLDKSPEHATARGTFLGVIIANNGLQTDPKLKKEARKLCKAYPWLRLARPTDTGLVPFEAKP